MAEDNFDELCHLRPVLDKDGQPVMSSGNFAVVFKMKDTESGKFHAVRCFHREQEGRTESYRQIEEALRQVQSPYLVSFRYMDKELFVDSKQTGGETEFPVLLMDWVEGVTLDRYIREHIDDKDALEVLAYRFSLMSSWLIAQPFAHGDLKPDNILVRPDGTITLVDYDGMFVPSMQGQSARELGSPDFRHPLRKEADFDGSIDDFSLVSILLSLKAIAVNPSLLDQFGASDRLLFSEADYRDISKCRVLHEIFPSEDNELNTLIGMFILVLNKRVLGGVTPELLLLFEPESIKGGRVSTKGTKEDSVEVENDENCATGLKIRRIIETQFYGKNINPDGTKSDLIILHLSNIKDPLIWASLLADDFDFVITIHAKQLKQWTNSIVKDEYGNIDFYKTLDKLKGVSIGTEINDSLIGMKELYGFIVNVSDIYPECVALSMFISGVYSKISTRRIVGIGDSKEIAKADAIAKEKHRLDRAINEGRLDKIYK